MIYELDKEQLRDGRSDRLNSVGRLIGPGRGPVLDQQQLIGRQCHWCVTTLLGEAQERFDVSVNTRDAI